ncbi:MAG: enolase C-terminal domain-like protein [Burkholderiaceae bacterium]
MSASSAPLFRVAEVELLEMPVVLRMPFRFGVVTLRQCFQAVVRTRIETSAGQSHWGAAAEMVVPKWFDKNPNLTDADNFEQERTVLRLARQAYLSEHRPATAFGHFARHHHAHQQHCEAQGLNPLLASYGPALLDRAVLDALCRQTGTSFYQAMQNNLPGMGEAMPEFAGLNLDVFLRQLQPAQQIDARHTVGLVDAITHADITAPVNDGLPETLEEVVSTYGHRYFKLKVCGNLDADMARLSAIAAVLDRMPQAYRTSLDGNEQYPDAAGLNELLHRMRAEPALRRLCASILFIEQPIARQQALTADLKSMQLGWPVIIDESDGMLDAFVQARSCGYSGISSKTCKGVYRSLLNAARCAQWNAQEGTQRFFMSGEDLTVQAGLSLQQDLALVNLIGITHVERNGHHYVNGLASRPAYEQQAFLQAHPDLYTRSHGAVRLNIQAGQIRLDSLNTVGYASAVWPDFSAMFALGQCPSP